MTASLQYLQIVPGRKIFNQITCMVVVVYYPLTRYPVIPIEFLVEFDGTYPTALYIWWRQVTVIVVLQLASTVRVELPVNIWVTFEIAALATESTVSKIEIIDLAGLNCPNIVVGCTTSIWVSR